MRKQLKAAVYRSARRLGLFRLSRRLTRGRLRILAYHGFNFDDESAFRPQLFMDAARFGQRLDSLRRLGYPVLTLSEAVVRRERGTLPDGAVVITVDDGFYSFHRLAVPELAARKMPATLYLTTYYCERDVPIFGLTVQYMLWRTRATRLDLSALQVPGGGVVNPQVEAERLRARTALIAHGTSLPDEASRTALARLLGRALDVDYDAIASSRKLSLMDPEDVREAMKAGVDVQLHTHTHRFPDDARAVRREIQNNRKALRRITGRRVKHLCYPSGVYHRSQFEVLKTEGVASATTCKPGLCDREQPALELGRFLDHDGIDEVEFEAELSGFQDLLRRIRRVLLEPASRLPRPPRIDPVPVLRRVFDMPTAPPWAPDEAAAEAPAVPLRRQGGQRQAR